MIRYRLESSVTVCCHGPTTCTATPIMTGTLELYGATRYLVLVVDDEAKPPIAVLRKLRG